MDTLFTVFFCAGAGAFAGKYLCNIFEIKNKKLYYSICTGLALCAAIRCYTNTPILELLSNQN